MNNPSLQSEIDARCPCFETPVGECVCAEIPQTSDYEQMINAVQTAYSWLQHAYQLMGSQGITDESVDSNWPIDLADAVHYCSEVVSELDPE